MSAHQADAEAARDALAGRLFEAAVATFDLAAVYMGDRLGLYRALEAGGPATSAELAARTGLQERYLREWLEHGAVTGILAADGGEDVADRRFGLPPGHEQVLNDELSLAYASPTVRMVASAMRMLPRLIDAFEHGGGVAWSDTALTCARQAQTPRRSSTTCWAPRLLLSPISTPARSRTTARVADWAVERAGHRSPSLARTRRCASMASTLTTPPSPRRVATWPRPRSPIASLTTLATLRSLRSRAGSTW
jgi:hypothetical protein